MKAAAARAATIAASHQAGSCHEDPAGSSTTRTTSAPIANA